MLGDVNSSIPVESMAADLSGLASAAEATVPLGVVHDPGAPVARTPVVQALQGHLSRWLLGYALAVMGAGVAVGQLSLHWTASHRDLVSTLTTVMVFMIIYPMMVNLKLEALLQAGRNVKPLALALAFNFVWAPVLGLALAKIFPPDPLLAVGFLLVMVVPCSSMTVAYTGLAKANVGLATMSVALSFLVAVVAVPVWMLVFASGYHVEIPITDMLVSIGTVLLAPMLAGFATRRCPHPPPGPGAIRAAATGVPGGALLAMFAIIFLIFFGKSDLTVAKWSTVALLLVPNALFIAITLAVVTWLDRRAGLSYADHMAVVFASTGKNNGTAIAIAATAFSPLVAIPAATMPIFQVMFLVLYLKLADRSGPASPSHRRPWRLRYRLIGLLARPRPVRHRVGGTRARAKQPSTPALPLPTREGGVPARPSKPAAELPNDRRQRRP